MYLNTKEMRAVQKLSAKRAHIQTKRHMKTITHVCQQTRRKT